MAFADQPTVTDLSPQATRRRERRAGYARRAKQKRDEQRANPEATYREIRRRAEAYAQVKLFGFRQLRRTEPETAGAELAFSYDEHQHYQDHRHHATGAYSVYAGTVEEYLPRILSLDSGLQRRGRNPGDDYENE